jgi:hypothetical protein
MNDLMIESVAFINRFFSLTIGNSLRVLSIFPYWISLLVISGLAGLIFIPVFKYFSNQHAVTAIRERIAADLLAIRIFKDNPSVMIRAQGRILSGSFRLLWHTVPSLLIMIVPISFLLTQMSGWYQFRPLHAGEPAVITVKTHSGHPQSLSDIRMNSSPDVEVLAGPVCIETMNELAWKVVGRRDGSLTLDFQTPGGMITKKLSVGGNSFPVSIKIPDRTLGGVLLNPLHPPPPEGMLIQSITITYGDPFVDPMVRSDWLVVFCLASLIVFWVFKRFFGVMV